MGKNRSGRALLMGELWPLVVSRGSMNTAEMMNHLIAKKGLNGVCRWKNGSLSMLQLSQVIRACGLFVCVGKERASPPQDAIVDYTTKRDYKIYEAKSLDEIVEPYLDPTRHHLRRLDKQPQFVRDEVARRLAE